MMRALIVEDDPQLRNLLTRVLEMEGYQVTEAADGVEGWQRMAEVEADLIITDFLMPRMDGLDLVRRLRSTYGAKPKIVVVSSLNGADSRVARQDGVNAFLPKPVNVGELRKLVLGLMG